MNKRFKTLWVAVGLLVLAWMVWTVALRLNSLGQGPTGSAASAVAVETAAVRRGTLRDLATYTGTLSARNRVVVASKVSGRLLKLHVDLGDAVRSGQVLAQLEDEEYRQQVVQAEADLSVATASLKEARSTLETAEKNLVRDKALHQTGFQSDAQLDQARTQVESLKARVDVALAQVENRRAALANARVRLSYTRLQVSWGRGSRTRYVGERQADEGSLLAVNTPVLTLVDLQPLTAVIHVGDQEYFRLKKGQEALIRSAAFDGRSFQGKVVRIAPMLQESSRQARVEVEVDNPECLLKPGMFVQAEIEYARHEQATIVPFNALARREGREGVFVVDEKASMAHFVPVRSGIRDGEDVEILEPARLFGPVVVVGHYLLETEGKVILPQAEHRGEGQ